jgi:hypothetical protein
MSRVKRGRIIEVDNRERVFGSALKYNAVWVEDSDGKNERCLLFTDDEIRKAEERAAKNIEDLTEKGFFTDLLD